MTHYSLKDLASEMSEEGWGNDFDTKENAKQSLIKKPESIAAYGIMEILSRLNRVASSIGKKDGEDLDKLSIEEDNKAFPGSNVGDILYGGARNLGGGVDRYVIVAKNKEDYCLIIQLDQFSLDYPPKVFVAPDWLYKSLKYAVIKVSEEDIERYESRLKTAKEALRLARSDGNLDSRLDTK